MEVVFSRERRLSRSASRFTSYSSFFVIPQVLSRSYRLKGFPWKLNLFETNIDPMLRFSVEATLFGSNWVRISQCCCRSHPRSHRQNNDQDRLRDCVSTCNIEVDTNMKYIHSLSCDGEGDSESDGRVDVCPLLIASFDIECLGLDGQFPDAENPDDAVVMVATVFQRHGQSQPCYKHLLMWKPCPNTIAGTDVVCVDSEEELLNAWHSTDLSSSHSSHSPPALSPSSSSDLILRMDPDIITGYNHVGFDIPYLLKRARRYGIRDFWAIGKVSNETRSQNFERSQFEVFPSHRWFLFHTPI